MRRETRRAQLPLSEVKVTRPDFEALITVECVSIELFDEPTTVNDAHPSCQAIDLGEDVAQHEHGHSAFVRQVGAIMPSNIRIVVDLPAPFSPRNA